MQPSSMQQTVLPGWYTGIYYLILAGLAFDLDWRDLMNHARKHNIDIEYAEVYPKIGGWLRVLDHETFLRAFEAFSGAEIKGNPILADPRNETATTTLMYPPPPLRRLPASSRQNLNHGAPRGNPAAHFSPLSSFSNGMYEPFPLMYHVGPVPYTQQSFNHFVPRQIYVESQALSHLVSGYQYNVSGQSIVSRSIHREQLQGLMETPVGRVNGFEFEGYELEAHQTEEGYARGSPSWRYNGYQSIHSSPSSSSKAEGKERERLRPLPDRMQPLTPVVVNGSGPGSRH